MMHPTEDIDTKTDEYLIGDVRSESPESEKAAAELFGRYEPMVKAIASNYFVPGGDADDVEQEGRLGLFKALLNYDMSRSDKFRPFAIMCIKQQILTAMRAASRQKNIPLNSYISLDKPGDDREEENRLPVSDDNNPEAIFIDREKRETMDYIINSSLSGAERDVLDLYIKGMTYKEIAAELRKTTKFVDNTIQSIKRKLKGTLK